MIIELEKINNEANKSIHDDYYGFDASNVTDVKSFQDWMDANYGKWAIDSSKNRYSVDKNPKKGYGYFRAQTQEAYRKFGAEYEALFNESSKNTGINPMGSISPKKPKIDIDKVGSIADKAADLYNKLFGKKGSSEVYAPIPQDNTNYGTPKDDKRGLSNSAIVGIVAGGLATLGLIIYLVNKSK
jgi:hypothetical protein